jgi:hypothetical protein
MAEGVTAVWCDFGGVLASSVSEATAGVIRATGIPEDVLLAAFDEVAARETRMMRPGAGKRLWGACDA